MGGARAAAVRRGRSLLAIACVGLAGLGGAAAGALGSARGAAAGARFDPASVTFVSLRQGWVLGSAPCASARPCLSLEETSDAGHSWRARPLPAALVAAADRGVEGTTAVLAEGAGLNVRFADPRDGWIYGALAVSIRQGGVSSVTTRPLLWSTHDGGATWQRQYLTGLGSGDAIFDVEAARGTAYLMETNRSEGVSVKSSPVAVDRWRLAGDVRLGSPAGGGEQSGAFVLQGGSGWLVEGNDRGTTGSARLAAGGRWVAWTPPCASVGHSFAIPAASTSRHLVAVCVMGGFAYPLSPSAPHGAKLGSSWLYLSGDGGDTFVAGPELGTQRQGFYGSVLASPSPAAILVGHAGENGGQDLLASFDGGVRWRVVYRGEVTFLGFTSPDQGVAISRPPHGPATMIMTFDGGRRWAPVSF
jgi:hypothetical protein